MVDISLYPSCRELYKKDPAFARKKVIEVYESTQNKSFTAKIFKTTRSVVRKILKRYKELGEEGLKDLSKRPKTSPNKTPLHI